jgi:hypothetical protein
MPTGIRTKARFLVGKNTYATGPSEKFLHDLTSKTGISLKHSRWDSFLGVAGDVSRIIHY